MLTATLGNLGLQSADSIAIESHASYGIARRILIR